MSQLVFDCEEFCCYIHCLLSKMVVSVILALMLVSCTCGENPAIQVVLTEKGLQYGTFV